MATANITLDKRASNTTADGKYPVVLRIGHQSKSRDISFGIHVDNEGLEPETGKVTGVVNAVSHSKRIKAVHAAVDLWLTDKAGEIRLWPIEKLIGKIREKFFDEQPDIGLLAYAGRYLKRLEAAKKYSTASSYETALKNFVKYRKARARMADYSSSISTLFNQDVPEGAPGFQVLPEFTKYDMAIKAIDVEFIKDLKAWLGEQGNSQNTIAITFRSLQAITNSAADSDDSLKDHKPFAKFSKNSIPNQPNPLTGVELQKILALKLTEGSALWHTRNYTYIMFSNMGMNFYDAALLKVNRFDGTSIKYTRHKTKSSGDHFVVRQSDEALEILSRYAEGKQQDDYLFPILNKETPDDKLYLLKKDKLKQFNKNLNKLTSLAGIDRKVSSYSLRDGWVETAVSMGIDLRTVSQALGHSSIETTNRHYAQVVAGKQVDEANRKIQAGMSTDKKPKP